MYDLILGLSILLQWTAAVLAFRLTRVTQHSRAWGIIALAISLIAFQTSYTGYHAFLSDEIFTTDLVTEWVTLGISLLMVIGLVTMVPFSSIKRRSTTITQQSEKIYNTLARVSPVGIFHTEPNGNCIHVNERWCEITGLQKEIAIGGQWGETLHAEDKQLVYQAWAEAVSQQKDFKLEYRFQKNDDTIIWVYGQATPEYDESGNVVSYVGTITDISDRKIAEQEIRSLMESAPDAMVIVNANNTIVRVNHQTEVLFNYNREELIGNHLEKLVPLQHRNVHQLHTAQYFENTHIRNMGAELDLYALRKDGSVFPVEISLGPINTRGEKLIVASIRDVTDRKNAEDQLRQQESQYRLLMDSTAEAIYGLDLEGICTFCNSACLQMLGYKQVDQLLGKNMHRLIHHTRKDGSKYPEDECKIYRAFINNQNTHVTDEVLWRADHTSFPAEYWSHPIRQNEKVIGSVVTFLDVSERKKAEVKLKESEERFRQLAESINQVFWLTDWKKKKVLYISPAYETIFGLSRDQAYEDSNSWLQAVHPDDQERLRKSISNLHNQNKYSDEEYRLLRKDGSIRWIKDRAFPVFDSQGEITRIAWLAEDITDQKKTEEDRKNLEAQLRQSQKLEAIGLLAGGIAHDFNNILTAIIGNAELLLRKSTKQKTIDDAMKTGLDQIDRAAKRAAKLTRQLLTFSRKQILKPVNFDLNKILIDLKPMIRSLLSDTIELMIIPSSTPAMIRADMGQIEQVLLNMTINARDALPEGGQLTLKTEIIKSDKKFVREHPNMTDSRYVCLSVSDNGIGMEPEILERIFEPFFTTKPVGKGTGLGLSTVYGIVEQSGGHIVTDSVPTKGTTFTLYFPVVK